MDNLDLLKFMEDLRGMSAQEMSTMRVEHFSVPELLAWKLEMVSKREDKAGETFDILIKAINQLKQRIAQLERKL